MDCHGVLGGRIMLGSGRDLFSSAMMHTDFIS
jgi:hypothetical protein